MIFYFCKCLCSSFFRKAELEMAEYYFIMRKDVVLFIEGIRFFTANVSNMSFAATRSVAPDPLPFQAVGGHWLKC